MRRLRVLMVSGEWPSPSFHELSPSIARYAEALRLAGAEIDPMTFHGAADPRNYARARRAIRAEALEGGYDVVHAHHVQCGLVALASGAPLVVTLDESDLQVLNRRLSLIARVATRRLSRWVARRCAAVIVPSQRSARTLPAHASVDVIPWGVDLETFQPASMSEARAALDLRADRKLVLYAGDPYAPWEPYVAAVEAVSQLRAVADATLVTAERESPQTLARYMNACDVLVVTSNSELATLMTEQALACDVPIVTSVTALGAAIDGIPGCWACDPDVRALVSAVERAVSSPRTSEGRRFVADRADDRLVADRVLGVYERVRRRVHA